jgi:ubiquinone/menaquinone biosynthesis C-methylase UbiE
MDEFSRAAKTFYDNNAETYDEQFASATWSQISTPLTFSQIKLLLKPGICILDAGGGTGRWAERILQTSSVTIFVLDISLNMLEKSRIRLSPFKEAYHIQGDISSLPFKSRIFDVILAELDVISYCVQPEKALEEIYKALKGGGFLHLSVDSLFTVIRSSLISKEIDETQHIFESGVFSFSVDNLILYSHAFTPDSLCRILEKIGFSIKNIQGNPIITHLLPPEKRRSILCNEEECMKLLELEEKLSKCPSLIGNSIHIEVTAQKVV